MSWVLRKDMHKRERRKNRQLCEPTYTEMSTVYCRKFKPLLQPHASFL